MSRPLRLLLISLLLCALLAAEAAWLLDMPMARGPVGGLVFSLLVAAGLRWRGRRPGLSRADKRRVFGHLSD